MSSPEQILSYWFPVGYDTNGDSLRQQSGRWFRDAPEIDRQISDRFSHVLEQASRGELDDWAQTPQGRLALIIVLDQFSRSVYKGSPLAYAQDLKAQRLTLEGHEAGMDSGLTNAERLFFMIPLGHSEDLALQEQSVRYFEQEVAKSPTHLRWWHEVNLSQAKGHCDVIARFGRHPHRNEVLGRSSTPEEQAYLISETPVHRRQTPFA
jgi:uncharacterized protein (DUF924 family)